MSLRVVLAIAQKDILDAVRNLYILFAIVSPVGISLLFSLLFPTATELKIGAVALYDQGRSTLVERIETHPAVKRVIKVHSFEELQAAVEQEAVGGLALSADFDTAVVEGRTPELPMLYNGRRGGGELAAFRRLVDDAVRQLAGKAAPVQLVQADLNVAAADRPPGGFSTQGFFLVLLLVMGLTMTGVFVVPTLLVEEKEKRTLKAILVSPAGYADVVAGKALAALAYAVVGAAVLLALNDGFRGNVALTTLAVLLGGLILVEVGLLMGAICTTTAQVNTWSTVIMLVLLAPTWTTGSSAPEPVELVLRFIPTHHIGRLIGLARDGGDPAGAWSSLLTLAGVTAVLFAAVVWSLRRGQR
ncbi:MAG: ABC transporter permease [Chloroflexi bacterium]|nr:ABC transporter permease [Chloroflexota bacterium]